MAYVINNAVTADHNICAPHRYYAYATRPFVAIYGFVVLIICISFMPLSLGVIDAWLGDIAAGAALKPENQPRCASPRPARNHCARTQEPQSHTLERRPLQGHSHTGISSPKRPRPQVQTPQQRPSKRRTKTRAMHRHEMSPPDSPDPLDSPERESSQVSRQSGGTADSGKASAGLRQPQTEKRPRGRPRKVRGQSPVDFPSSRVTSIEATGNLILSPSTSQHMESRYGKALMRHVVSEPARSGAATSPSRSGKLKSRNLSPVKSLDDMHIFDKPVSIGFVNKARPIPKILRPSWDAIENICANIGILPRSIEAQFKEKERLHPFMISLAPVSTSLESVRLESRDFEDICEVQNTTVKYWAKAHEAAWNSKIHQKILDRALKPFEDRYESHNVTAAKPIKAFAPTFKDDLKDPKVVDFAITHIPSSKLEGDIRALLRDELNDEEQRTINQTYYLRYQPALLSIETKKGYNDELDANFKLAMWTIAWQVGISRFTRPGTVCTPLPGIVVYGHVWELQWAIDAEDTVYFIKHPEPIGNTATIAGCYRLLAAIRYLVSVWSEEVFLPWFIENVIGEE